MTPELTPEAWAQIRYDYEHTDRPIEDICAEHGISSGTLRDRMRRWGWTRRRSPISLEGPPPSPAPPADAAPPPFWAAGPAEALPSAAATPTEPSDAALPAEPDDRPIAMRLQSAVDRVLPAIEATVAKLGTGPIHPREMERAARALTALTRTLRELKSLLGPQLLGPHQLPAADDDPPPADVDEMRNELARRIDAFVESRLEARQRLFAKIDGR
jgi:hypothetical protein